MTTLSSQVKCVCSLSLSVLRDADHVSLPSGYPCKYPIRLRPHRDGWTWIHPFSVFVHEKFNSRQKADILYDFWRTIISVVNHPSMITPLKKMAQIHNFQTQNIWVSVPIERKTSKRWKYNLAEALINLPSWRLEKIGSDPNQHETFALQLPHPLIRSRIHNHVLQKTFTFELPQSPLCAWQASSGNLFHWGSGRMHE